MKDYLKSEDKTAVTEAHVYVRRVYSEDVETERNGIEWNQNPISYQAEGSVQHHWFIK